MKGRREGAKQQDEGRRVAAMVVGLVGSYVSHQGACTEEGG